jgi:hypothetical protein
MPVLAGNAFSASRPFWEPGDVEPQGDQMSLEAMIASATDAIVTFELIAFSRRRR